MVANTLQGATLYCMTFALFVLSVIVCLGLPSEFLLIDPKIAGAVTVLLLILKGVAAIVAFTTAFELQDSARRAIKALTSARQPSPPPPAQPSAAHSRGTVAQQRP